MIIPPSLPKEPKMADFGLTEQDIQHRISEEQRLQELQYKYNGKQDNIIWLLCCIVILCVSLCIAQQTSKTIGEYILQVITFSFVQWISFVLPYIYCIPIRFVVEKLYSPRVDYDDVKRIKAKEENYHKALETYNWEKRKIQKEYPEWDKFGNNYEEYIKHIEEVKREKENKRQEAIKAYQKKISKEIWWKEMGDYEFEEEVAKWFADKGDTKHP